MFSSGTIRGTTVAQGIPCLEEAVGMEVGQSQLERGASGWMGAPMATWSCLSSTQLE